MPTAVDLRSYAGQWIAVDKYGEVIDAAPALDELEQRLVSRHGCSPKALPPIRRVPEAAESSVFLL